MRRARPQRRQSGRELDQAALPRRPAKAKAAKARRRAKAAKAGSRAAKSLVPLSGGWATGRPSEPGAHAVGTVGLAADALHVSENGAPVGPSR